MLKRSRNTRTHMSIRRKMKVMRMPRGSSRDRTLYTNSNLNTGTDFKGSFQNGSRDQKSRIGKYVANLRSKQMRDRRVKMRGQKSGPGGGFFNNTVVYERSRSGRQPSFQNSFTQKMNKITKKYAVQGERPDVNFSLFSDHENDHLQNSVNTTMMQNQNRQQYRDPNMTGNSQEALILDLKTQLQDCQRRISNLQKINNHNMGVKNGPRDLKNEVLKKENQELKLAMKKMKKVHADEIQEMRRQTQKFIEAQTDETIAIVAQKFKTRIEELVSKNQHLKNQLKKRESQIGQMVLRKKVLNPLQNQSRGIMVSNINFPVRYSAQPLTSTSVNQILGKSQAISVPKHSPQDILKSGPLKHTQPSISTKIGVLNSRPGSKNQTWVMKSPPHLISPLNLKIQKSPGYQLPKVLKVPKPSIFGKSNDLVAMYKISTPNVKNSYSQNLPLQNQRLVVNQETPRNDISKIRSQSVQPFQRNLTPSQNILGNQARNLQNLQNLPLQNRIPTDMAKIPTSQNNPPTQILKTNAEILLEQYMSKNTHQNSVCFEIETMLNQEISKVENFGNENRKSVKNQVSDFNKEQQRSQRPSLRSIPLNVAQNSQNQSWTIIKVPYQKSSMKSKTSKPPKYPPTPVKIGEFSVPQNFNIKKSPFTIQRKSAPVLQNSNLKNGGNFGTVPKFDYQNSTAYKYQKRYAQESKIVNRQI